MDKLKEIRDENNISTWLMGRLIGVPEDYYRKLEKMNIENVPPIIKIRIEDTNNISNRIKDYLKEIDSLFKEKSLKTIFDVAKQSYEDISNATLLSVSEIKNALENEKFNSLSARDKLNDYALYMNSLCNNNDEQCSPESENIEKDDLVAQMPDIPETNTNLDNKDYADYEERINGLTRQLDWYEQIIDTFTKLANLASK